MIYKIVLVVLVLLFSACESKPKEKLDAKKLIHTKCGSCHNLELPPKSYENETAPPMMAVSFHIINFMQVADDSMKVPKAKEFVKDYVFPMFRANAIYEGEYLLGTSIARPLIAKKQIETAAKMGEIGRAHV